MNLSVSLVFHFIKDFLQYLVLLDHPVALLLLFALRAKGVA